MPTNVPPQYVKAEERFREALTPQAKIAALQEMLSIIPKHKGTDHLKAQLRSRMSKLMDELEGPSTGDRKGQTEPFSIPKEGDGRATLVGPTNVGKSLLLNKATGAQTRVGAYELTTQEPVPAIWVYEGIHIQLVDTPPISNPSTQSRLYGLLRNSEIFVIVVDLALDPVAQTNHVFSQLGDWGFRLLEKGEERGEDSRQLAKPAILVGNRADIDGSLDAFQDFETSFADRFPIVMASAEEGVGLDDLGLEIFKALRVIRVFTKSPRVKLEDFERIDPVVLDIGSTVSDAAEKLHKELAGGLKYAVLWGQSGKFQGQRVGRDHELTDEDIVELHS